MAGNNSSIKEEDCTMDTKYFLLVISLLVISLNMVSRESAMHCKRCLWEWPLPSPLLFSWQSKSWELHTCSTVLQFSPNHLGHCLPGNTLFCKIFKMAPPIISKFVPSSGVIGWQTVSDMRNFVLEMYRWKASIKIIVERFWSPMISSTLLERVARCIMEYRMSPKASCGLPYGLGFALPSGDPSLQRDKFGIIFWRPLNPYTIV